MKCIYNYKVSNIKLIYLKNFNALFIPKPNGRFEVGKKICLSISGHHPETWQPSWSSEYELKVNINLIEY